MKVTLKDFLWLMSPYIAFALALILLGLIAFLVSGSPAEKTEIPCNCTVNINGSIMGVEDGFYYLIEGLSEDQADEVQVMINNSLEVKQW